jgi:hypothetical protein
MIPLLGDGQRPLLRATGKRSEKLGKRYGSSSSVITQGDDNTRQASLPLSLDAQLIFGNERRAWHTQASIS